MSEEVKEVSMQELNQNELNQEPVQEQSYPSKSRRFNSERKKIFSRESRSGVAYRNATGYNQTIDFMTRTVTWMPFEVQVLSAEEAKYPKFVSKLKYFKECKQ